MACKLVRSEKGAKYMVSVNSAADYRNIRGGSYVKGLVCKARTAKDKAEYDSFKVRLPQFNYNLAADGPLKGCGVRGKSVAADIDFKAPESLPDSEKNAWYENEIRKAISTILEKKETLGLLMLERSVGHGVHFVVRRHADKTHIENLRWVERTLGLPIDWNAKDLTRVYFATTSDPDDLIFLSDELFDNQPAEMQVEEPTEIHPQRAAESTSDSTLTAEQRRDYDPTAKFGNYFFKDIIKKMEELHYDGKSPVEGERNVRTYEYALILRSICDYRIERLQEVIPNFFGSDGEAEYLQCLQNALKEPKKGMPYRLRTALDALKKEERKKPLLQHFSTPPVMPKRLPKLIKLLTRNVPERFKETVASAVFPFLGAHLHGVKFKYIDNKLHEGTFMTVVVARQSSGKSYIKEPIECIMRDILERDAAARARENEWKRKNPSSKTKRDPRPEDICIQMLPHDLTSPVFTQRLCDANRNGERYLCLLADEVECLKKTVQSKSLEDVATIIKMAFDNALWGQDRSSAESVTGISPLRFNFCVSTTPKKLGYFFSRMVDDGTVSRLDMATIPPADDDFFIPKIGNYDDEFMEELKPFLERLDSANGLIECKQANKLATEIARELFDAAHLYDSEAYKVLAFRANVIGWLKGMVLFIANGMRWDKSIEDFVRWSVQYNLYIKMRYFGDQLAEELADETSKSQHTGPQNLLDLLPDSFVKNDYYAMRQAQGLKGQGDSTLRAWKTRGYISFDDLSDTYVKTDFYMQKFAGKL